MNLRTPSSSNPDDLRVEGARTDANGEPQLTPGGLSESVTSGRPDAGGELSLTRATRTVKASERRRSGDRVIAMTNENHGSELVPRAPDIDQNGVDRAQIREMLDLTPAERMLVIQNLADSIAEIRRLNGPSAVR